MNRNHITNKCSVAPCLAIVTAALLACTPVFAGGPPLPLPDFTVDYPAGIACTFPLHIEGTGGHVKSLTFVDKSGNPVRIQSTGTGSAITFTNANTGSTLSTRSNGSEQRIIPNADGSITLEAMGNTVIILFDTDTPPGPSTTLYSGRVVIRVDDGSVFTLVTTAGAQTDICATLL